MADVRTNRGTASRIWRVFRVMIVAVLVVVVGYKAARSLAEKDVHAGGPPAGAIPSVEK